MRELIAKILAGDKDAYRDIVREYGPMIRVYLAASLRDPHQIEDLCQEVFVAAFWSLRSFDPAQNFRAWLGAIARNKLMSHLRREYGEKRGLLRDAADIHELVLPDLERFNPDTGAVVDQMQKCIDLHPAEVRQLIEARYFSNEPVTSIAERLKTTVSAVSSQLYRIRLQLRQCIERSVEL